MKIAILGSGNVATAYARKFMESGNEITSVYSKHQQHAGELAKLVNAKVAENIKELIAGTDVLIISVSDHAIEELTATLGVVEIPVFHTAGSVSIHVLANTSSTYGVIYPLQSLRKNMKTIPEIPVFIDGNRPEAKALARKMGRCIGENVYEADDVSRKKLHMAAVFCSNFTNYMYVIAKKYTGSQNLPFTALLPLIEQTANRLRDYAPEDMQTGPALRGDFNIIQEHLNMLEDFPDWKEMYEDMSNRIFREFNSN